MAPLEPTKWGEPLQRYRFEEVAAAPDSLARTHLVLLHNLCPATVALHVSDGTVRATKLGNSA